MAELVDFNNTHWIDQATWFWYPRHEGTKVDLAVAESR